CGPAWTSCRRGCSTSPRAARGRRRRSAARPAVPWRQRAHRGVRAVREGTGRARRAVAAGRHARPGEGAAARPGRTGPRPGPRRAPAEERSTCRLREDDGM
ncbi:unnamed protein product, partial [Prorocentrum cordatum]